MAVFGNFRTRRGMLQSLAATSTSRLAGLQFCGTLWFLCALYGPIVLHAVRKLFLLISLMLSVQLGTRVPAVRLCSLALLGALRMFRKPHRQI